MVQEEQLRVELFHSGYCTSEARIVDPVHGKGTTRFYAVWALLWHKELGYMLYDTGYTPLFFKATKSFPNRLYRWATPVFISDDETAVSILAKKGIAPNEIKYVIISHFHADHICGLADFTEAKFICTKGAYQQVAGCTAATGIFKAILKPLLPDDFESRVLFVEDISSKNIEGNSGLIFYDLFNKQEIKLVLLPGHARGMTGLLYEQNGKKIFYATDASWDIDSFNNGILPSKIVKLFFDSWHDYKETIARIKTYINANPDTKVLFTHCKTTLQYIS